jgi:hypothetical protein
MNISIINMLILLITITFYFHNSVGYIYNIEMSNYCVKMKIGVILLLMIYFVYIT